jgi:hypothetical protein
VGDLDIEAPCCILVLSLSTGATMYVIRELMYCRPGKVRSLVEKFHAMNALSTKVGMPPMRLMTDFAAERYWTVVAEMEVESLEEFEKMMSGAVPAGADPDAMKQMDEIMKGYHELVDHGKREIYRLERPKA